jgi:hypothetical protein
MCDGNENLNTALLLISPLTLKNFRKISEDDKFLNSPDFYQSSDLTGFDFTSAFFLQGAAGGSASPTTGPILGPSGSTVETTAPGKQS